MVCPLRADRAARLPLLADTRRATPERRGVGVAPGAGPGEGLARSNSTLDKEIFWE